MTPYLGKYVVGCMPLESALGIYENSRGEWFVHVWREDYGPFATRQAAVENMGRIVGEDRVQAECWLLMAKRAVKRLLFLAALVAAIWLFMKY